MKTRKFLVLLVCLSLIFTLASCELFDSLKDVRAEAIAKVEALAEEEAYASLDKAEVSKIVETAKKTIGKAATEEGIEKAVTIAKNSLDKLVLDGVKEDAKAELKAHLDLSLYSDANKALINDKIAEASGAIDKCADAVAVAAKLAEAKAALDEIKPALDEAKEGACASLDSYVDLALYSEANKALIEAEIAAAKAEINGLGTVEAVAERLNSAKAAIDEILTLLDEAKLSAVATVEGYIVDLSIYSEENVAVIARIINDAKVNIKAAESEEVVAVIVEDAKADLDDVLTIVEENAIKAQALKDIMVAVPTTTRDEIYIEDVVRDYAKIEDGKLVVDTADLDGSTALYFGSQDRNSATVLDTYFAVDYTTVTWSKITIRFRAWDDAQNYFMLIQDGSIKFYKAYWEGSKKQELLMEHSVGIHEGEVVHLQIVSCGWTKKVLINGECIFAVDEDTLNVGRIYVETWQAGVVFINPTYTEYENNDALKAEYQEEFDKPCVNKTVKELLNEAKAEAKAELASYLQNVEDTYSEAKRAEISEILNAANSYIDACTVIDEIAPVVESVKAELNNVMTLEEEAALNIEKADAKTTISNYLSDVETLYSAENQAIIATIIENGNSSIDQCGSVVEVKSVVDALKQQLDAVLTLEEEANVELLDKRAAAVTEIKAYLTDVEALYSEANQLVIAEILSAGELTINDCESVEAVNAAVVAIKAELDAVLTVEEEILANKTAMAETFMNSLSHTDGTNLLEKDETTGEYKYMSIQDGNLVFNTKVASLGGQFQFGQQSGNMNRVFDTKITINYNSTKWDYVTIRFAAWDTSGNFKMIIKHDSIKIYYCKYKQDDLLLVDHTSGIANGQEAHLQIISKGWLKMVVIDGVCIFKYSVNVLNSGYTMISPWECGIVFNEPTYKVYSSETEVAAEYGDVIAKESVNELVNTIQ